MSPTSEDASEVRIAVIGTGRIGSCHAETLARMDDVDSVVLADVDASRARVLAAELGVECVADADVFEAGVDGVVVASPTAQHAAAIVAAVEAGIRVFCEKPVTADLASSRAVADRVARAGGEVHIGFQRRFDPGFARVRQAVSSGALGWLHTVRANTFDPAPPPAGYIAGSGGIFRDCGIHDFDALRWVTGQEVVSVTAVGANQGADYIRAAGDVDTGAAVLTLQSGTLAQVALTRYNGQGYDVRFEAFGECASLAAGLDEHLPLRSAEAGVRFPTAPPYTGFLERFAVAYAAELAAFVASIAERSPSPCTIADDIAALEIAEACALSRAERRTVEVEEVRR
jgi:myo-inositol 2-dehydrogenase/D-chiro-inositol 1-dehydrogenase